MKLLDRLPNWLRAGVATALIAAFPTFVAATGPWLEQFLAWLAGEPVQFPDISVLRAAIVGLGAAAALGAWNAFVRRIQQGLDVGSPPVYVSRPDAPGVIRRTIRYVPQLRANRKD